MKYFFTVNVCVTIATKKHVANGLPRLELKRGFTNNIHRTELQQEIKK